MISKKPKISCIIRDLQKKPPTINFIPKGSNIEIIVSNWKAKDFDGKQSQQVESMAVARNDGALNASGDIFVFLDGDVKFAHDFFWQTINECKKGTVVGLRNPYHRFLQGAYIVIHREDFFHAGGVDPHMFYHEDIAFSYKLECMGYKLILHNISNIELLDDSPTRFCQSFRKHFRVQLAMTCLYPKQHLRKLLRTGIFDFFYHKYIQQPREQKQNRCIKKEVIS